MFSFYNWGRNANKTSGAKGNMYWPTIAPSAIRFYGQGAIPGWNYSLLIPSLKNGLWRLKLKPDGLSIDSTVNPSDTMHYLAGYRLRNVTVAPTGDTLFVAVDNSCCTLGASGTIGHSVASPNLGFILRMVYLTPQAWKGEAARRATGGDGADSTDSGGLRVRVYPNPAFDVLHIQTPEGRGPWMAQVFTATGVPVVREVSGQGRIQLDVHALRPGVYMLRLASASGATRLITKVLIGLRH
jgi:hypothetical protein